MKHAQDYLDEANAVVPRIAFDEAQKMHAAGTVFVDVRDSAAIAQTGTVAGALRIPRGMIEFAADPASKFHNAALDPAKPVAVLCALGGQAALTGKTLKDMGYAEVFNVGGFGDWKEAGGATEPA